MKHGITSLAVLLGCALVASGQQGPIVLQISPVPEPSPALKYQLLPDAADLTPGNAAILYYRALSPELLYHKKQTELFVNWLKYKAMPLKDFPREELAWILKYHPLKELDRGARRQTCDWEMTARVREEGFAMLLPEAQEFRQFAMLLAMRARLELAEGRFEQAIYTFQTGFALARHVSEMPFLIGGLVGIAMAGIIAEQVDEFIQTPGSPNLYWALTALPRPFINMRNAWDAEKTVLENGFPELRNAKTGILTVAQQHKGLNRLVSLHGSTSKEELLGMILKSYPEAKRFLLRQGRSTEEVEALPMLQVVYLYSLDQFIYSRDHLFKCLYLPYPEAIPALEKAEQDLKARKNDEGLSFASAFLPALNKVHLAQVRTDRRIAAMRCIEAMRIDAHANWKLPDALSDITEVPIPTDPGTGKAFEFKRDGDKATLSVPPLGKSLHTSFQYEITINRFTNGRFMDGTTGLIGMQDLKKKAMANAAILQQKELDVLWTELTGTDVAKARAAMRTLAAANQQSLPFLKERLQPAQPVSPQLFKDLDNERFEIRQKAADELEKLGEAAVPGLQRLLAGKPSLEVHKRVEEILKNRLTKTPAPERLRELRALVVLEVMGTPEAKKLLDELSKGDAAARLTKEAKAALERLAASK